MQNILITGASKGLGLAFVEEYAKKGFFVLACSRSGMNDSLKGLQEKFKGQISTFTMDVTDKNSIIKAAAEIKNTVTSLDIIINDAAVLAADYGADLESFDVENCLGTYNTNTLGPLRVTQAFLGMLEKGELKNIVNITSLYGSISSCNKVWSYDYAMSKAALNMQTVLLQNYLKDRRIKLLIVDPGSFWSGMAGTLGNYSPSEAAKNVMRIVDKYGKDLNGPTYLNYKGDVIPY